MLGRFDNDECPIVFDNISEVSTPVTSPSLALDSDNHDSMIRVESGD